MSLGGLVRTTKLIGYGLALVAGLWAWQCWLPAHDKARDETRQLRERDAVLVSLTDTVERLTILYYTQRQQDSLSLDSLRRQVVVATVVADSLKTAGVVRYVELRGAIEPSLRPILDSLQSTHALTLAAKDSVIGSLRGAIAIHDAAQLVTDSVIATQGRALTAALEQRDGWRERASPGLIEQARKGLPWMAAGALVVLILRH